MLNQTDSRINVIPADFYLTYHDKDQRFHYEFSVPPEKLANKYRSRAKWRNFFRAFAAEMTTTTSQTYESGTVDVYGRNGSATGVYSGTTTTTTTDAATQRRAAQAKERANAIANQKSEMVLSEALRANTISQVVYSRYGLL